MKPTTLPFAQVRRAFSTNNNFASQRSKYQAELSNLRKAWQNDFQLKQKLEQERKDAEKKRIVLEKAIKLREQRKVSKVKQEQIQKEREEALLRYKEKLAATHLLWEEKQALRSERKARALEDLKDESAVWITAENIDSRITEDLFTKTSATTGYSTKYSNYWKHHVFTPKLERIFSDEFQQKMKTTTLMGKLRANSQFRIAKRLAVENFLDQIIGTGQERSNFKKLVGEMSQTFDKLEGFEGMKGFYENEKANSSH